MASSARRLTGASIAFLPLVALALLWGSAPLGHDDLFWHMRTAEIVFRDGIVPTTDPFSYTRAGEPFVSHEWGFGVLLLVVYRLAGFTGLLALQGALAVAILGSLWALLAQSRPRTRDSARLIPPVMALALWAGSYELKLNAAPLTTLFLIWEILLLQAFRRTGRRTHVLALALLFLLWSNVHCGVLFGFMVLGFWWLEEWMPSLFDRAGLRRPAGFATAGARLALLAGAFGVSLLNPNGVEALLYPVRLSIFLFTSELPLHMGHFTAPTPADRPGFFLLVVFLIAGILRPGRLRRLAPSEILSIAAFLILSLRSNRFLLDFAVLASPALLKLHGEVARLRAAALVPVGTAAVLLLPIVGAYRSLEPRLLAEHFPQRAAAFLEREGIDGHVFNHQNYGGYLGWRLRAPVFWDGRNEVFGPLMKDLVGKGFGEIADRYGVDVLLVTEQELRPLQAQILREEWGLVYWDDHSALYVRRIPRFREVLDRHEYHVFPPFPTAEDLDELRGAPDRLEVAQAELERILVENPESRRARYYRGLLSLYAGNLWQAKEHLEEAGRMRPSEVVDRALLEVLERLAAVR